ncbi:hypothetical protein UlMin_005433 [Ulmus minor]
MADKQSHLNGAYYGPSIPPPNQTKKNYYRPGRGADCCCCGCLFSLILKLVVTAVVLIGLAVLAFWLIVRPNKVKFHVEDASLTQFNYTNNNLHYNLALNLTIRNPNKRLGIYYDRIEARGFYEDSRFDSVTLTPFYQGHKNTSVISAEFKGQNLVLLDGGEISDFNNEKSSGIYSINVKLYLRIRFKLGKLKSGRFKPKIDCDLKVPLSSDGKSAATFQRTECDIDY